MEEVFVHFEKSVKLNINDRNTILQKISNKLNNEMFSKFVNDLITGKIDKKIDKHINVIHLTKNINGITINMLILKLHIDTMMIKLAKLYGFPRGFKIVYTTNNIKVENEYIDSEIIDVSIHGFYPKFENDKLRNDSIMINLEKLDEIKYIEFFKKFSGFLGSYFTVKINDFIYVIATCKNSAYVESNKNKYVDDLERLFTPYLSNKDLLNIIHDNNLTLSFEVMSKNDQTHGTHVINEGMILTAISTNSKSSSSICEYFNLSDLRNFGLKYNLGTANLYSVRGNDNIKNFLTYLNEDIDIMTDNYYETLINNNNIEVNNGNLEHKKILGDILEGFVIHTYLDNSIKVQTIKVKCIAYVIRTMCIRETYKQYLKSIKLTNDEKIYNTLVKDNIAKILPRWCKEKYLPFWIKFANDSFNELWTIINSEKYETIKKEDEPALHIVVADKIFNKYCEEDNLSNVIATYLYKLY